MTTRARLLAAATLMAAAGCGDDGVGDPDESKPGSNGSSLVVTLPDGKSIDVHPTKVECGPSQYGHGVTAVKVRFFTQDFRLIVEVVPADVAGGKSFRLPIDSGSQESGPRNALMFFGVPAIDPATGEGVEASTDVEDAKGTLRVDRATCDPLALDLTVDASLGSELFDGEGARIKGRLALGG